MKNIKDENGITLVVLIITIIVMLILIGVAIAAVVKSDLIGHAEKAAGLYKNAENQEETESNNKIIAYLQSICDHSYENGVCTKCGMEKTTFTWKQTGNEPTIEVSEEEKIKDYKIYGNELLPDEYQEIEYLESTGTQLINTGVIPANDAYFGIDFAMMPITLPKKSDNRLNYFYGASGDNGNGWLSFEFNDDQAYWNIGNVTYVCKHDMSIEQKYEYSIRYANGRFTSTGSLNASINYTGSFGADKNFVFFNASTDDKRAFSAERLYYLKLYVGTNQNLVRDFIPCYRKSDNKAGLYDLVNNVCYYNASGTESPEFNVGNNVFSSVGDLVTESSDENYNKYKISVAVTNGGNTVTYDIYLDEPLRKLGDYVDYIDFKNGKIVRYTQVVENELQTLEIPEETSISLPEIILKSGSNTITVQTKVKPSDVEIVYY